MMKHPSQKIACNQINYPLHPPDALLLYEAPPRSPLFPPLSPYLPSPFPTTPFRPWGSWSQAKIFIQKLWNANSLVLKNSFYCIVSFDKHPIHKLEWKLSLTLGTKWIRDDLVSSVSVRPKRYPMALKTYTHPWKICWIVVLATRGNGDVIVIWVT